MGLSPWKVRVETLFATVGPGQIAPVERFGEFLQGRGKRLKFVGWVERSEPHQNPLHPNFRVAAGRGGITR